MFSREYLQFVNDFKENTHAYAVDYWGHPPCGNCGCVNNMEDFARGDVICSGCGLVQEGHIQCHQTPYSQTFDDFGNRQVGAPPANYGRMAFFQLYPQGSPPYKRQTYFVERLTQWCQNEPAIKEKDLISIQGVWNSYGKELWYDSWRTQPTKQQIRHVLDFLDGERKRRGKKPRFVRVYLEKWLTIRFHLSGVSSTGRNIRWFVLKRLRELFDYVQRPFDNIVKPAFGRHSLINYNFLIRRFLDLLGLTHLAVDFPPLKTIAKQKRLIDMWLMVIASLHWPYVNNDQTTFPHIKFYVYPPEIKW